MKAEQFDKTFDDGVDDIVDALDLSTLRRPHYEQQRITGAAPVMNSGVSLWMCLPGSLIRWIKRRRASA